MIGSNIVVGLDIGTSKVCTIAAEMNGTGAHILGVGTAPSAGLRKGVVINIDATVESIRKAVKEAESYSGTRIKSVCVGISGSHIEGFTSTGAIGVKGKEVRIEDVERAIDSAKAVYIPLDRDVLHVLPMEFILDGQEGIVDPVGMAGVRLEARVHIVTGAVSPMQNLIKCCKKAELEIADMVLEPLASAHATLTEDENEYGVVLIDIGGGTTDIALFRDGCLRNVSVLGIGGSHLTNDLAIGLRIHMHEAEKLKKESASAFEGIIQHDREEITITHPSGQEREIPRRYLVEIIQPRCEEMLNMIKEEIKACYGYELATCGVVLTGGASQLKGFDRLAESVFGLPVRIGVPGDKNDQNAFIKNPIYATGVGLLTYKSGSDAYRIFSSEIFSGVFGCMKDWVKGSLDRLTKFQKIGEGGISCLKLKK